MLQFRFEAQPGIPQFSRAFSRFGDAVEDFTEAFEQIADDFYEGEEHMFSSGGSGAGGWAPLAASTVARKGSSEILVETGILEDSLTSRSGAFSRFDLRPKRLEMGTQVPYGIYHQTGTSRMPARPPVKLAEDQKSQWVQILHAHIVAAWRGEKAAGAVPLSSWPKEF